jgi:hypothetical protein
MTNYDWTQHFKSLYDKALRLYQKGTRGSETYFDRAELTFLDSIGATAQELYDLAEDAATHGEPDYSTALLITAARRDYFLTIQNSQKSDKIVTAEQLPAKTAQMEGIEWLPRIIEKAQLKLRGEMAPEIMYGCGGDRRFLSTYRIHPADFLRVVWSAKGDHTVVVDYIKKSARSLPE